MQTVVLYVNTALYLNCRILNYPIMEKEYTPETIEDCIAILDKVLSKEEKAEIKEMNKSDFTMAAHFGLGMWIRNNLGGWKEDSPLVKNTGPSGDSLSPVVLEAYYNHLTKES